MGSKATKPKDCFSAQIGTIKTLQQAARIMKITAILLLGTCLHVYAVGFGQKVTLTESDAPIETVFKKIEQQTKLKFLYTDHVIKDAKKVSINIKDAPIEEALSFCFKEQPFDFEIKEKTIVIRPKRKGNADEDKPLPPIDISGRITDEEGNPLQGANVKVKGTMTGTTTNSDGVFVLKQVNENAELEISYIGFQTIFISIKNKTAITLSLKRAETSLQEVIINKGYYTETRKLSTGNVGRITAKEIDKQPVNNPLLALEGRVPGLFITQANGLPGAGVKVRIQGQNSLTNGNAPLYVIDGVPILPDIPPGNALGPLGNSGEQIIGQGNTGTGSALSFINASDIESIEILKDADATAIYGSRAANGAVLITTKKGKAGKMSLDINAQHGWGKVTRTMKMLDTRQYLDMRYEALRNDGLIASSNPSASGIFTYAPDLTLWDTTRYTDWKKILIGGTAEYTNISASITGGSIAAQYRIGGTFQKETTVFPNDYSDQKASVHFNLNNSSSSQKFKFQLSASYLADNNHLPNQDLTEAALLLAPNAPSLYNDDGNLNWEPNSSGTSTWKNPLSQMYQTYEVKTTNLVGSANISYKILPGLEVSSNFGYNNILAKDFQGNALLAEKPEDRPFRTRMATYGNRNVNTWIVEPKLNYKISFGNSKIDLLAGSTFQETNTDASLISGINYNNDEVLKNPAAAGSLTSAGQVNSLYRYNAIFGRFNYNFKEKYIINLTGRRDGSSRFGDNNKFHNFGGVGLAWIFSQETFLKKLNFLSFGKLKGSYGTTGNDQIGDYRFLSLYSTLNVPISYQGTVALTPGEIQNAYLAWEETRKFSFGIELGFFSDRIILNANYNRNRSSNQLLDYKLPNITGRSSVLTNFPATVQNTGWELAVSTVNFKSQNVSWSSNINLTIPRNKLIDFPKIESSTYATSLIIGEPVNVQRVYHFAGVDPATGLYLVADKNGNPTTTPSPTTDRTVFVSTFSDYYGGFQNSLQFHGFELDIFFQFVKQSGTSRVFSNASVNPPGWFASIFGWGNQPSSIYDEVRWQKAGDNATLQRFTTNTILGSRLSRATGSDANFKDAAYARLRNASLSWEVPASWRQKIKLQSLRLHIRAQNLLTISNYKGLDPENQSFTSLPPLRMITVGFKAEL
jgi:TonB-linked SusC/RagA family outer membrane protein